MQDGSALSTLLPHCATSGARHEISQRAPSITALHMLPVLPTIELVVTPRSPSTELVTLDELREVIEALVPPDDEVLDSIELETPDEVLESMELEDWVDVMVWAEAHVHRARAIAARYLISVSNVTSLLLMKH